MKSRCTRDTAQEEDLHPRILHISLIHKKITGRSPSQLHIGEVAEIFPQVIPYGPHTSRHIQGDSLVKPLDPKYLIKEIPTVPVSDRIVCLDRVDSRIRFDQTPFNSFGFKLGKGPQCRDFCARL